MICIYYLFENHFLNLIASPENNTVNNEGKNIIRKSVLCESNSLSETVKTKNKIFYECDLIFNLLQVLCCNEYTLSQVDTSSHFLCKQIK